MNCVVESVVSKDGVVESVDSMGQSDSMVSAPKLSFVSATDNGLVS